MFLLQQDPSSTVSAHYFKGPGHTTDTASLLSVGTPVAAVATMGAGALTIGTAGIYNTPDAVYSCWRTNDGSAYGGWLHIGTYTGDGTGTRNIPLTLNGKSPLFALVVSHGAVGAHYRDASHTGSNSCQIGSGNITTAITGGAANQLTVGATLNTNLVVYEVFVIGGGVAAGWSPNPSTVFTVAPEAPAGASSWPAAPAQVSVTPVSISVPAQWRMQRFDLKPRREEHA
jgi:hypothetical protein